MKTTLTKKLYEAPKAEVSIISDSDIITASPGGHTDPNQGTWDW